MDYGFEHDGTVYTPNSTPDIAPAENDVRNRWAEQHELRRWAYLPEQHVAYYTFPHMPAKPERVAEGPYRQTFYPVLTDAHVSTWLGTRLGTIISARVYRHAFGGRFVALRVLGTNGAEYYGRASYDWGTCVTLHRAVPRGRRYRVTYQCRDIGYGVESGTVIGVWGKTDSWGKRQLTPTHGPVLYLFPDEIVSNEKV